MQEINLFLFGVSWLLSWETKEFQVFNLGWQLSRHFLIPFPLFFLTRVFAFLFASSYSSPLRRKWRRFLSRSILTWFMVFFLFSSYFECNLQAMTCCLVCLTSHSLDMRWVEAGIRFVFFFWFFRSMTWRQLVREGQKDYFLLKWPPAAASCSIVVLVIPRTTEGCNCQE